MKENIEDRPRGIALRQQWGSVRLEGMNAYHELPIWQLPMDPDMAVVQWDDTFFLIKILARTDEGIYGQALSQVGFDTELKLASFEVIAYEPQGFVKIIFHEIEAMSITVRRLYWKR